MVEQFDCEQGTPEWHEIRSGVITGSRFKDARDKTVKGVYTSKARLYAMDLARQRCGGSVVEKFQTVQMKLGREQEHFARRAYERRTGNLCEAVGFLRSEDKLFGLSPDSLVDDDGVLEIKLMASSETLFTALVDGDISEYIDQCNGYLWLLGRQWVDLVLWAPDLAEADMVVIRIERNENDIEALEKDLMTFAAEVRVYESKLRKKIIELSAARAAKQELEPA